MAKDTIEVEYNLDLKPFEELLSNVKRPGSFFVAGSKEMPMPKIVVEGVGILAFPMQEDQIKKLIGQAVRAPFGRGQETLLDISVRKVWQIAPEKVEIGGLSWSKNFDEILLRIKEGLGCHEISISADLYKLLVYDEGSFFLAHRDTEKAPGMFGTLVIVLPSTHRGGELIIRHSGHEVKVDMSGKDVSELAYTAFYADCEHEVLPLTEGNRVALVYNLIQKRSRDEKTIGVPIYDAETEKAAKMLKEVLIDENAPTKLVWLLEHEYSRAELSFATLKNRDSAIAKVLVQAAQKAGCAIHLGIVHIEESGSAEPLYDRYSRSRDYWNDDPDEYEVNEVFNSRKYIDGWVDVENKPVNFEELPLEEDELLPFGALDDAIPDEERFHHSTGNDGASFERAYVRASIVIWRRDRYTEVLLQAGIKTALLYFKECVDSAQKQELLSIADLILKEWEATIQSRYWRKDGLPGHSEMLLLLKQLGDLSLLERFIKNILYVEYDGSENRALVSVVSLFDRSQACDFLSSLVQKQMPVSPGSCIELLHSIIEAGTEKDVILKVAQTVVLGLKDINKVVVGISRKSLKPINASAICQLWSMLIQLQDNALLENAVVAMMTNAKTFDPVWELIPALCELHRQHSGVVLRQQCFAGLWQIFCVFLLERSEYPPALPQDWKQKITISCSCDDCKELGRFASDPVSKVYRFKASQEKRSHVENEIRMLKMDMSCETDCNGRPHTLICTKNRRSFETKSKQYHEDIRMLTGLAQFQFENASAMRERLFVAIARDHENA